MDLLILKKNLGPGKNVLPAYRGTERARPVHFANLPDTHVANQLFFWFMEEGGESGVVHDPKKAKQLVELLNLFGDSVFYELVQVGTDRTVTSGKGGFLGFDVSAGFKDSIVRQCVVLARADGARKTASSAESPISELSKLHQQFFKAKLNDHQLFQQFDDAEFCFRAAQALNALQPGWIGETDLSRCAVTSVYKVL